MKSVDQKINEIANSNEEKVEIEEVEKTQRVEKLISDLKGNRYDLAKCLVPSIVNLDYRCQCIIDAK